MTKASKPADALPVVQPHVVLPNAIYSVKQFQQALGLRSSTVRREVRLGRLRISKRAGKYFLLGEWVLDWLRAGELRPRQSAPVVSTNGEKP